MALTEAQKKRLKAHAKHHTKAHMNKMVKMMKAGKTFSEAHSSAMKSDPPKQKQKQKQTQSQKVVVNVGTVPRRRGRKPRAVPRPMSYQQDTARVLAQFATPLGMPQQFNPTPTIMPIPQPRPFRPEVSQAQMNQPRLADLLQRVRPITAEVEEVEEVKFEGTPGQERITMGVEDIRSRMAERRRPKRNANLDDTPQEAAEQPMGLSAPAPLNYRQISDGGYSTTGSNTTAPLTPFQEEDEGFLSDTTAPVSGGPSPSLRRY